jgi:hypothetical protein
MGIICLRVIKKCLMKQMEGFRREAASYLLNYRQAETGRSSLIARG